MMTTAKDNPRRRVTQQEWEEIQQSRWAMKALEHDLQRKGLHLEADDFAHLREPQAIGDTWQHQDGKLVHVGDE